MPAGFLRLGSCSIWPVLRDKYIHMSCEFLVRRGCSQSAEICKRSCFYCPYFFDLIHIFFSPPSKPDTVIANGEDTVSSEEEKEDEDTGVNVVSPVTDSSAPSSCAYLSLGYFWWFVFFDLKQL